MRYSPAFLAVSILIAPAVASSTEDDMTSLSYISYMERYATIQPAEQDDSVEAVINLPVMPGDRLDSSRGSRIEIQLADGSTVWLDEYTSISFDAIALSRDTRDDRTVLYLAEGSMFVEIPETGLSEHPLRVDSNGATMYLTRSGLYRLDTLRAGNVRLEVWDGLATVSSPTGATLVRAGSAAEIDGISLLGTEPVLTGDDMFAEWMTVRRLPPTGPSRRHVGGQYGREAALLDTYGDWVFIEEDGVWAWNPGVSGTWSPYRYGRWYWTPTGWTWLSYEPWGWLPYHYGDWFFSASHGWVWTWHDYWGPAWVNWMWWDGWVGWCPAGYYSRHWYWWGGGAYWSWWGGNWWTSPWRYRPDPPGGGGGPGDPHRRTSGRVGTPRQGTPDPPSRLTADLRGRVSVDEVDPRPWRMVQTADFGSPHLGRLTRSLDDVRRALDGGTARVVNGPLLTEAPGMRPIQSVLGDRFSSGGPDAGRNLTPVFARSDEIDGPTIHRLVSPTTRAGLVAERELRAPDASRIGAHGRVRASLAEANLPLGRSPRQTAPNIHRPDRRDSPRAVLPDRAISAPRTGVTGRSDSTLPRAVQPGGTSGGSVSRPSVRRPVPSTPSPRSGGMSSRPVLRLSPRSGSSSSIYRPSPRLTTPRSPSTSSRSISGARSSSSRSPVSSKPRTSSTRSRSVSSGSRSSSPTRSSPPKRTSGGSTKPKRR